MARKFMTGLEVASIEIFDVSNITASLTPPSGAIAPHGGNYALYTETTGYAGKYGFEDILSPVTDAYIRSYMACGATSPADTAEWLRIEDSNGIPHLRFLCSGVVAVWDIYSTWTVLGTMSSPIYTGSDPVWQRIEVRVVISNGAGIVRILRDGVEELSLSGVDTLGYGADLEISAIFFGNEGGASMGADAYIAYDDIAINDPSGIVNDSYPGAGTIIGVRPTADSVSGVNDFIPLPNTGNNYPNVDDVVPDDSTTVVYPTAAEDTDTYIMEKLSTLGISNLASVAAVAWNLRVRLSSPGSAGIAPIYRYNGLLNSERSTLTVVDTSWHYVQHIEDEDPVLSNNWSVTTIDASEFGFRQKDVP